MTIDKAIQRVNWAKNRIRYNTYSPETEEALDMAIRSLNAWDKVIKTLTNWKMECAIHRESESMDAYWKCINLIEHTMEQEVSDDI